MTPFSSFQIAQPGPSRVISGQLCYHILPCDVRGPDFNAAEYYATAQRGAGLPGISRHLWGRTHGTGGLTSVDRAADSLDSHFVARSPFPVGVQTTIMDSAPASSAPRAPVNIPPLRPRPLDSFTSDFVRQQVAKQQHSNYHSTSLRNMVSTSVNRTALHPTGVQYVTPTTTPCPRSPSPSCPRSVYLVHFAAEPCCRGYCRRCCCTATREFFSP